MSLLVATVLNTAADAFIGTLLGVVTETVLEKLKGDPAKKAYKAALGAAIQRYAVGEKLAFAAPLLDKDGLLSDESVAAELSQLLRFEREPDVNVIGDKWKSLLDTPPEEHLFSEDAGEFVSLLEQELRKTDVYGPVFEAIDLNALAASSAEAAESLQSIEAQLDGIAGLLTAGFGDLIQAYSHASFNIKGEISKQDFSHYIAEKTLGFVGRQWVFEAIDDFVRHNPRGYYFVIGDPGIGKSSLAAQLVKQNGYAHFFNIRAEGINRATTFLKNMCAQLIAAYSLNYSVLPPETTDDAGFLNRILGEISEKLPPEEKCVLVIDALDEADPLGTQESGSNLLYLPISVPKNVYFVVTCRPPSRDFKLPRVDCELGKLEIIADSSDNLADVADFLKASVSRPRILAYITSQAISSSDFVELMLDKSSGNFMYLRYVLPEIERGAYQDLSLDAIPAGLENYYQDHWQRMRGQDENAWFEYKLPIIVALTVVREPISVDLIQDFSRVKRRARIREVLTDWSPFLHELDVEYEGGTQKRYRLYHASFFDFISAKEVVADERVDLKAMHGQIADTLWGDLFDED